MLRFAPSPNGPLHRGHALSALANRRMADALGRPLGLRMEDIDIERCPPNLIEAARADLAWLGVRFECELAQQSTRFERYRDALETLKAAGLVYPSYATRREIIAATAHGARRDPDGAPLFPGDDIAVPAAALFARRTSDAPAAWRLDMAKAAGLAGGLTFLETDALGVEPHAVRCEPLAWGDVVLARKDTPTSYHLSVVVDDADQAVSHVVRGRDLYLTTAVHRLLQTLLGLPAPRYHHHALITGDDGRKLAKSNGAVGLAAMRENEVDPAVLRADLLEWLHRQDGEPHGDGEQ
ncbi:MAG: tRNA glutamyl-Q(34) synthetase GluQRS [Pseudomonadota bacterium]